MLSASFGIAAAMAVPTQAQIAAPVPTANYIVFGGLHWAWANPCAPEAPTCGPIDLTYQSTQGWRAPTAQEWAKRPTVFDFGTADNFRCASAWFSVFYTHCDYTDPDFPNEPQVGVQPTGVIWDWGYGTSNYQGYRDLAETWLVRGDRGVVPEPATWAMLIAGFGLVGAALRRRATAAA